MKRFSHVIFTVFFATTSLYGDIVLNADGEVYKTSANPGNALVTDGYMYSIIGDTNIVNNGTGHTITDNLAAKATLSSNTFIGTSGSANPNSGVISFYGSNGVTLSATSNTITVSTPQDLQTNAAPTFAGLTLSGRPTSPTPATNTSNTMNYYIHIVFQCTA